MCSQEKKRLSLTPVYEGLKQGIKSDGKRYSVRDDRSRYFFPEEWVRFINTVKPKKRLIFSILINTGARIEEAINIRPRDFDWDRNNLTLRVTKGKAKKKEFIGKKRTFTISSQFARRARRYIKNNKIGEDEFIYPITKQAVWQLMRRTLQKAEFEDWYQFSLHNIRKTSGNWLRALGIPAEEICLRLGHDMNTYLRHYGSPSVFDRKDKILMIRILGDVYEFK